MFMPALRLPPRLLFVPAAVLIVASTANAQAKRPLTHRDYDAWRTISSVTLSPDGKVLAYAFMPYDADGEVVIRDLATGKERREPVGALPPAPIITPDEIEPGQEPPPPPRIRLAFTSDSRWLIASTYPLRTDVDKAKRDRKKPEDMPKQGMLIVDLTAARTTRVDRVKSFQVPERGGAWIAYLMEADPAPASSTGDAPPAGVGADVEQNDQRSGPRGGSGAAGGKKEYGTNLVLRDLARGDTADRTFASVLSYTLARDGRSLVYAVSSKQASENGVYVAVPGNSDASTALVSGNGDYQKLTWDRAQQQIAFFRTVDLAARSDSGGKDARKQPQASVFYWDRKSSTATELVTRDTAGLPDGMVVSDKGALAFCRDGQCLMVSVAPPSKPDVDEKDLPPADDRVVADLWRSQDDLVQPMQKVQANRERGRTYTGIWDFSQKKYVQLADASVATVTLDDTGTRALGMDARPYRRMVDYDGNYSDVYVVDAASGARRLALTKLRGGDFRSPLAWSPDGRYAAFFRDGHWFLLDAASLQSRNVTRDLPVKFAEEEDDTPDPPGAYGTATWLKDGSAMLINDRYDVWRVPVDGSAPRNLTAGGGRKERIVFRIQRLAAPGEEEEDARYLDPARPLYLRGESEVTRSTGYFRTEYSANTAPQRLLWGEQRYDVRAQAKNADVLIVTASRFDQFPDLQVTDSSFRAPRKVTDGDAQRKAFLWGTAELIDFRNVDGLPLKGVLYKPENFDPAKKYPLMVYIYERLSQNLHNFVNPTPSHNINISFYVSNGYLVLTPDIVYQLGNPGPSALKCVLPAIDAVVARGFVDEQAIGIQGHSWGGYQIAYMVTKTTRFRAAEAGAPVGNMTSAYSGIRWGSGLPRQFQYEQTQSRIGKSLYESPLAFFENSAVFHAAAVQTPLLILANDNDDAVPWYQGIELFLALRRNGKEAYLFNYNGEFHGLRRRPDQRDYAIRMQQFFDHFLKGAPEPEWMEKGIPYIERDEEKTRFQKALTDGGR